MHRVIRILRYAYFVFIAGVLLFCFAFALMQTKWAKEKIAQALTALMESNDIAIQFENLEGSLPFTWHAESVVLNWKEQTITLSDVKMRIAILPLIRKNIVISYFNVEEAHCAFLPTISEESFSFENRFTLPYRIVIQRLKINSLVCQTSSYYLLAEVDLGKNLRHFKGNILLSPRGHPDNAVQLSVEAYQKLNYASLAFKAHLTSLKPFDLPYPDCALQVSLSTKGKWTAWSAFLKGETMDSPLKGTCTLELNHNWKADARFAIENPHSIVFEEASLQSNLIAASLKGTLEKDVANSTLELSFSLPDISLFKPKLPEKSAHGTVVYSDRKGHLELYMQHVVARIQAERLEDAWRGQGQIDWSGEKIPFSGTFDFYLDELLTLNIDNVALQGPEILLAGNLSVDLQQKLYSGALYGKTDCSNAAALGLECQFSQEMGKQNARISIVGKNAVFHDATIDAFSLTASINDIFDAPVGKLHFTAQQCHTPLFDIDSVDAITSSDESGDWPFAVHIKGHIQEPVSLYAEGKWRKEDTLFTMEINTLSGKAFTHSITLQEPFLFEMGKNTLSLSPVQMAVGTGFLYATCDCNRIRSTAELELKHFPLKFFSLFYPNHALTGSLSLKGYLDARKEHLQGNLHAALEEIEFEHFDKKEPFHAKGSLQAHIDNDILQAHAFLTAINNQFIDWRATLPIEYGVYPLHVRFDTNSALSAELIAEGRLQDLFDFINLGIHRATGFVSSRLFLSNTLSSPQIQGNIKWQDGTYENFLTGTALNDIQAEFQADKNELRLTSFVARDDKRGTVSAEGSIALTPEQHFPFKCIADLENVHTVHFTPLDCNLSGSLYIFGNLKEAFAQGNLLVPRAEFRIPDRLPFEVPILPVTYVNTPHTPGSTSFIVPRPAFPFRIHLELSAEDHVFVNGKGLKSEWKGSLLVNGTNINLQASGTLQLVKGEYALFGKTFKLTEGQIIFNDKPSINLSGTLALADTVLTAHLIGPLSSPTLTLQSNPQLSTSAILARILFNKDISDISQPEAIQLATALISLSGGAGPSVLEAIRKNIGVDRLTIASQTAHPEEIAVQIGKYLTKGVLITLSQSATSSQVIVEVEFNYGFVFQAETQEEQEGKFSLKWTHSY